MIAFASAAPALAAAQADDDLPSVRLDTAVVTSVRQASPTAIVTDPKAPRQPVPASDGADVLKTIPGFAAIRNGGANGDPVLRGMFGSRLNILANGTAMPGACPARMDAPTSYIAPQSYDKLIVVKGPQTVLWGPGASAGTVRFERNTKRFDTSGVRGDGSVLAGSWGRNDQAIDVAAGTPDVYARVTANHAQASDYRDGDGRVVPSRWDKWNVDAALGWTPDAHTRLELSAGTGDGSAKYAGRGMDGVRFRRDSVGLRFEKSHLDGVLDKVQAQFYYNAADHLMDNYTMRTPDASGPMPMPMASEVGRRTAGGRVAVTLKWQDRFRLDTGIDAQESWHRARSGMGVNTYRGRPWQDDAAFANVGLFGELTWFAGAHDRVIGGARLDRASVRDERAKTGGMMPMPNPTMGQRRHATLPGGFLRYERDAGPATFYAGLGHAERMPDYWELFSPGRGPAGTANAFSAIRPEKTTQLDVGAQYHAGPLDAWASGYVGHVRDFILFRYLSGGMMDMTSQASNVDARIAGGELGVAWQLARHWRVDGTLAYAWGRQADGTPLPQMPPLDARFGLNYDDGTWSWGALWRVVAPQHRYALHEGNVVGQDFGPSAGFGVLSLNAGYRFGKHARLTAGIDNVFDKTYAEHLNLAGNAGFGYPARIPVPVNEPGRTIWARFATTF